MKQEIKLEDFVTRLISLSPKSGEFYIYKKSTSYRLSVDVIEGMSRTLSICKLGCAQSQRYIFKEIGTIYSFPRPK